MKKKSPKKDTSKGLICADCGRHSISTYAKSLGKGKVMYVCWACFNTEEE